MAWPMLLCKNDNNDQTIDIFPKLPPLIFSSRFTALFRYFLLQVSQQNVCGIRAVEALINRAFPLIGMQEKVTWCATSLL